ncbi:MAG: phosphopentomutase [Bacillales bacterium]|nr:phosphopentomutase [Bacillales bacterium]
MKKYKRIFLIVCDSLGIGEMADSDKFNDKGTNTFVHISQSCNGLKIPNLNKLGIGDLDDIIGTNKVEHKSSYVLKCNELSNGKDTMTGHWEMMGIYTTKPFKTFTESGFPEALIKELEDRCGRKIVGNCAASGTEIIKKWGEHQLKTGDLIVYTSADSVLQIAANEDIIPVPELYHYCDIAREICLRPEYYLGRIIARPFIGTNPTNFKRTPNRHDLALSPSGRTYMNILQDNNYTVSCIGKISDIFNGVGVTKTQKTISNLDGMNKTILEALDNSWKGLCFVNLVEFDSEYGHRRDPIGYGKAIEEFDIKLGELLPLLNEDDLLMITADHGNDPTWEGSDHTREKVPLIIYSKSIKDGRKLNEHNTFADIGATIITNFDLKKENQIGEPFKEVLN